jgi:hypothetical protein
MGTFIRVIIFIIVLYLGAAAALPWVKYKMFENAFKNAVDSSQPGNIPVNILKLPRTQASQSLRMMSSLKNMLINASIP